MKKTIAVALIVLIVVLGVVAFSGYAFNIQSQTNDGAVDEKQLISPSTNQSGLTILIDGLVEHPYNLTYEELHKLPAVTVNASLQCVGSYSPNYSEWTGVKLKMLLDRAGLKPTAIKVAFYASDGFSTDLPINTAIRDDVIVAYKKDGVDLADNCLVVPDKWGYKWIHSIVHIEIVDYDYKGEYESLGYSDEADIVPTE